MSDIRKILCPTDLSDSSRRALDHALAIAQWHGGTVTLFHVLPAVPVIAYATGVPMMPSELLTRDERSKALATMTEFAPKDSCAHVEFEVGRGHAANVILAAAESAQMDLIVMGTHGRSGFERLVLGSVTEKVLRKATCPVLVVPPHAPDAVSSRPVLYKRVLCAVDFSKSSMEALSYATSLAEEAHACLSVLHVVELPPGLPSDGIETALARPAILAQYISAAEDEARVLLTRATAAQADSTIDTAVAVGKPYREILRAAATLPADLIVIGVRGRGTADRLFFGSTAEHVVRQATCPVLTLRKG
jgi:nucleotide-binding universal stress UspA family protein